MDNDRFDTDNMQVQMVMVVKLQQLQREGLARLTYKNLEDYLNDVLWKDRAPAGLAQAADQVMKLTTNDIVHYLSRQAIKAGSTCKLSDFSDLLGG